MIASYETIASYQAITGYYVLLVIVVVQRLAELALSVRNGRRAISHGGVEAGRRHFRVMVTLHLLFLLGCAAEPLLADRPFIPALGYPMVVLFVLAQGLRYWAIAALGPSWNVRVIVVPGQRRVSRGPYRLMRHPNYLAVIGEGVALPLIHTAWLTALLFSLANAVLLVVRIRCEESLLQRLARAAEPIERCAA